MAKKVLIIGGSGRIGASVAADLLAHTPAEIVLAGRDRSQGEAIQARLGERTTFQALELADLAGVQTAIRESDLVIHCAGPFHHRDARVLQSCIEAGVHYLDVSDHPSFTRKALTYHEAAEKAGVTAIINTGIFPGISNSMVRQGVEKLDDADTIHLSYLVSGSGGAGMTVMRTTFLGLRHPFEVWVDGTWQTVKPYSDREVIDFPAPYGKTGVYWFDMPEAFTLPATFPVKTVITKFGSVPDLYNHLTWVTAHWFPPFVLQNPAGIEFLARVSHFMTSVSDRMSGIGVAIRSEIRGTKEGKPTRYCSTLVHENTAVAAGYGTGSIAEFLLTERFKKPGVWPVEQALTTDLFEESLQSRGLVIHDEYFS